MNSNSPAFEALQSEKLLLTELSIALSEINPANDLAALLTEQLQKITGSFFVAFLDYEQVQQSLIPVHVKAEHKTVQKAVRGPEEAFLRKGLFVAEDIYQELISHGIGAGSTLNEVSFGIVPEEFERPIQSARIFDRYYRIAFAVSDKLYGASFIGLTKKQPDPSLGLLHFFSWMAAISLRRKKEESEKILAIQALRESEEKFRAAFTVSPDSISISRLSDGKYIEVNDGFLETTGYTREEVVGKTAFDLNIWENPADRRAMTKLIKEQGHATDFKTIFKLKDGKKLTGLMSARIFNIQGIPHMLTFTRDITEQKKIEQELRQAEFRFRALIENAPDGIVLISREGAFKYISPSAKKMFFYENSDLVYFKPDELTHPEDLPMVLQNLGKLISDPSFIPVLQYRFLARDGTWRWIESTFTNLLSEQNIEAIVINFRDINDRKKAEEEINLLNLSLEKRVEKRTSELTAANKELEAFAYTVSHDLRAPVRAIGGFTKILEEDFLPQLDAEGQRVFRVILENTSRMEHLIDDLLSFSRLNRADMNVSVVNMSDIVMKCYEELTNDEMRKKIDFTVTDLPLIRGDFPMLAQVWTNLLSNAIKYTSHCENPRILIECHRSEKEFVFSIKDNGTGFDMKYEDKLFGVFQRLHSVKEYEGTGVGLAIVQRIIQRHGGRIWAKGEVGKGAIFSFTLKPEGSPASTRP